MKKFLYSLFILPCLVISCTGDSAGLIDQPPFAPEASVYSLLNRDLLTIHTMVPGCFEQAYEEIWVDGKKRQFRTEYTTLQVSLSHITLKKKGRTLIDSDYEWVQGTTLGGKDAAHFMRFNRPGGAMDSLMALCYFNNMLVLTTTNDENSRRYFFRPVDESQIDPVQKDGAVPDKL